MPWWVVALMTCECMFSMLGSSAIRRCTSVFGPRVGPATGFAIRPGSYRAQPKSWRASCITPWPISRNRSTWRAPDRNPCRHASGNWTPSLSSIPRVPQETVVWRLHHISDHEPHTSTIPTPRTTRETCTNPNFSCFGDPKTHSNRC